jgi:fructose-1,6-bisphosphatase/inositol monophosphatase family enzyme
MLFAANLWDVAAGLVLAREAGVVLSGTAPAPILAAGPGLWPEFSTCAAAGRVAATGA